MSQTPDRSVDARERAVVIDSALKMLVRSYVLPDVAERAAREVRERVGRGEYEHIRSAKVLGDSLTEQLRAAAHDQHIGVRYWPAPPSVMRSTLTPEERRAANARGLARINHTFERVERFPGNIGYIAFTGFTDAEAGAATVAAAMTFVANTDALIFDIRRNGGGTPEMVALLASYLVGPDPVHINTLHWREGDSTRHFWTRPNVPGKRYLAKPVYVLTSKRTFSAAEEFAYDLQSLRRATVVGDTTGGGAHPGMLIQFLRDYQIFIPMGRAINPVTKTNWEGTGVRPDIPVPAERALNVARLSALQRLLPSTVDSAAREEIRAEIDRLTKEAGGEKR